mmetsp:Transcript_7900/g.31211  ORF Transcript_7900/g.31211 Transcript_7900/m.31211 type:complete len:424 (-) Transcript_7900:5028-6299(-)
MAGSLTLAKKLGKTHPERARASSGRRPPSDPVRPARSKHGSRRGGDRGLGLRRVLRGEAKGARRCNEHVRKCAQVDRVGVPVIVVQHVAHPAGALQHRPNHRAVPPVHAKGRPVHSNVAAHVQRRGRRFRRRPPPGPRGAAERKADGDPSHGLLSWRRILACGALRRCRLAAHGGKRVDGIHGRVLVHDGPAQENPELLCQPGQHPLRPQQGGRVLRRSDVFKRGQPARCCRRCRWLNARRRPGAARPPACVVGCLLAEELRDGGVTPRSQRRAPGHGGASSCQRGLAPRLRMSCRALARRHKRSLGSWAHAHDADASGAVGVPSPLLWQRMLLSKRIVVDVRDLALVLEAPPSPQALHCRRRCACSVPDHSEGPCPAGDRIVERCLAQGRLQGRAQQNLTHCLKIELGRVLLLRHLHPLRSS